MARRTNKTTDAQEWQGAPFSEEEIEFSPFMFDKGQGDAAQQGGSDSTASGVPAVTGGQFSDADMEFEPFMFDQGTGVTSSGPLTPAPVSTADFAPFSTSPFADPAGNVASPASETAGSLENQTSSGPITGSDLPLPSYLATDQAATTDDSAPSEPEMVAAPSSADVEIQDAPAPSAPSTPDLAPAPEPAIELSANPEPDVSNGSDEQLTGRVPSGPLTELPTPSTSTTPSLTGTSPNLGRVRGNTGPLGPLPPDRTGSPNTSWSDSSLASIEDFSSILIALHAGKKLRQSGSLTDDMVAHASPSATTAVQDAAAASETLAPAPMSTPEHMGVASQVQDMPEWAVQATQSSPLTPEMAAPVAQAEAAAQPTSAPPATPAEPEPYLDPIQYRQVPADSVLNELEPNIAQALKNMDPSVAPTAISGDELEFEGFMFDTGASTPMASLSASSPEELASLASDLGPAFDPAPYSGTGTNEADNEETISYDEIDPSVYEGLTGTAQPGTMGEPGADSKGGLPFWLQFEASPPASGPLGEEDLPVQSNSAAPAANAAHDATSDDFAAFGDLPPIEPFDFSLMPTTDTSESLGFNTEELTGGSTDLNDPMTATINLAAVAALLGTNSSGPLDTTPASTSYDEYNVDAQPDAETSLSLGTPESWSPTSDEQGAQSQDASASMDASTDYSYPTPSEPLTEDVTPHPSWSEDVAPELGLDAATGSESPDYTVSNEAPTTQIDGAAADLSSEMLQAEPEDSSLSGGGWMASATTGLAADSLATSDEAPAQNTTAQSDQEISAKHALAVEGLDVAPFDLTQLEVEEEPPTGYLEAQEMMNKYGTANLDMADDAAHAHDAGSGASNWSSETDTSYFASSTPTEVELAQARNTSSFTSPLTSDLATGRKAGATDYLGEEAVAEVPGVEPTPAIVDSTPLPAEPLEIATPLAAAPEVHITSDASQDTQEEEQPIKARVARGPWTSYSETTDFTMPAPQAHTQAQTKDQPEPVASSPSGPLFEQSVRLPAESELMSSGPLPSIAGFDDLIGLVANNPQDIGAHMALASAYAQAEDFDSALRVYRRIIKKPTTSETMLKMIWDDLSDLGPQAQHLPRYHQLSGDLLLRLGRHREAVEAYNKLQSSES